MKLKPLATLLMALSLGACSSLPEPTFNTDFNTQTCCSTLNALPLTALSTPFHQQVVMDANLPTLSAEALSGSEIASSQALPVTGYRITVDTPFSLLVRSYIDNNALFAANIRIYDGNWQLISDYSAETFDYQTTGMRGLERIESVVTINPQLNGAKYIVIASDTALLGKELTRIHPEQVYADLQNVIGNKQLPLTAEYQPFGVIDVTTSASDNNAVLTLLAELSTNPDSQRQLTVPHTSLTTSPEEWPQYREQIDAALEKNNVKQAAEIANKAEKQGITQAKDYLVQQLAQ
ncbi:MalM family protein [Vibrio sp. J1-1]|uniref:MalM family protein n=1 Tax=Vibrio sp. J1-1 TaxID=2912251 RepID=UPI001EFF67E1|nr:MalM family protein [Vibrio sp. J1-1]MCF7482367.1 MalM family protein [Vibrio sp. J1-1]